MQCAFILRNGQNAVIQDGVLKNGMGELRFGFTTGSCAAAASKAAVWMLLSGKERNHITIDTPKGIAYEAEIEDIRRLEDRVRCAVRKDGGDDPDITTGSLIYSEVSFTKDPDSKVVIEGGEGVGTVTKPGLDRPVGDAAINSVPRQMIEKEVLEVCEFFDFKGGIRVIISVPGGEELALKTFNPKLGIEGGISIIGTSGIVEPMSTQAILDTIRLELKQRRVQGYDYAAVSPGNYGLEFMQNTYGYDLDKSIKCSNFIGVTMDMAAELGFKRILYVGHIGKLIKVAGGIMNTHSKEADCRMEIMAASAARHGADIETVRRILDCVTTEEAIKQIEDAAVLRTMMQDICMRICGNLNARTKGAVTTECIVFTKELGELGQSKNAKELVKLLCGE